MTRKPLIARVVAYGEALREFRDDLINKPTRASLKRLKFVNDLIDEYIQMFPEARAYEIRTQIERRREERTDTPEEQNHE